MEVSIGITAHNEARTIGSLLASLLSQKTKEVTIKEIIVVSSGSTDDTDRIATHFSKKDPRVILLTEPERKGKTAAINIFLQKATADILAIESADTLPLEDTIEKLCRPFKKKGIGIVASHPIPQRGNGLIQDIVALQWRLHHRINRSRHKFGELIAFRNILSELEEVTSDEEFIAMHLRNKGYQSAYAADAIVQNHGPSTVKEFLNQRRRWHAGHVELKRKHGHTPTTYSMLGLVPYVLMEIRPRTVLPLLAGSALEITARTLGKLDHLRGKNYHIWDIATSTKREIRTEKEEKNTVTS